MGCKRVKGNDVVDAVTFQREVKRIEKLLFRIAWSYLGSSQDVEDTVQDALIKAWEKKGTLRDQTQFRAWLVRILSNQCKNVLRKRRRWSFFSLEEAPQVPPPQEEAPVMEAIARLKPEQRAAVTLYYLDGCTVGEIAEALNCPQSTIKTRLHSARKQLKKILLVEWEEQL
ncbi:MAG: RNA polymerase sigma factor [Clostridia bacterium]|nr:RNA polymerase sigma factor [Clostridia bacterium]